ncbi:MAG: hypothetical protein JXA81_15475 [Sedimentisphaerales bacterium]|nr:hypothetical protein [Sedimentisphaerales bacterium]
MNSVAGYFRQIPIGIWVAIIGAAGIIFGAVIAWLGVWLQLRHDSKERERERQMSLRRDVYLKAAEEIGNKLALLVNFYDTNQSYSDKVAQVFQQIYMIGNDEILKATIELNDYFNKAFGELAPERQEIGLLEQNLNTLGKFTQKFSRELDKSVEEMKQYNLQGIVDERKWNIIQSNYEFADKRLGENLDKLDVDLNRLLKHIGEVACYCIRRAVQADELVTAFIIVVRKELKTPFDEEAYRRILKVSHEKAKDDVATYVSSVSSKYEKYLDVDKPKEEET